MQYMCSKTGDEGSIYAARQGMRACNNTNIRHHIIKDVGRVYDCCIPSSPVSPNHFAAHSHMSNNEEMVFNLHG